MTAIDFLVEKLKLESIDLSLWHQNLIDEANENLRKQIEKAQAKKGDYCAVCGSDTFWNDEEE